MVFVWVNLFLLNKPYKDRKCNTMCTMAQRVLMHLKPIFRCFCAVNIPNKGKKDVKNHIFCIDIILTKIIVLLASQCLNCA